MLRPFTNDKKRYLPKQRKPINFKRSSLTVRGAQSPRKNLENRNATLLRAQNKSGTGRMGWKVPS